MKEWLNVVERKKVQKNKALIIRFGKLSIQEIKLKPKERSIFTEWHGVLEEYDLWKYYEKNSKNYKNAISFLNLIKKQTSRF